MTETSLTDQAIKTLRGVLPRRFRSDIARVPVVKLSGAIGISGPLRPGLSISGVAKVLDRAFSVKGAKAVALVINSPGGSATQSHLIFTRIRALAEEKQLKVIAFVEDVAASGGYMIACAADEIIADPNSIVGSIGVVGGSFGAYKLLEKIGVERRLYTSGENKAMLDPFLPEKPDDVRRLKAIQQEIHDGFIGLVKDSRGARLAPSEDLFTGEYWTGRTALGLGLIDGLGDIRSTLRERFGDKVEMPLITPPRSLLGRAPGGVSSALDGIGAGVAGDIVATLDERALWARYGL
ncbi:putative signal peptide peptidase SppA [Variibacter gotjawalensis]|uniref:Putative signal peptide peptidase SppA n=1 Tax=Variibacter gotjawalensis TaxID=1333996 RepID=A0A0S3PT51_9BRAD|nr:S49 family peptidase [Variibacter gotjawalensis]NIK49374.1 serine protease SohB [Variibacter gotjawalensis]RZS51225.1 serine protease SohB [Variibacter gotjawalensis]BAT59059.1 putative signal peptide peptidase SppA [Variibacter gotjawalensis]